MSKTAEAQIEQREALTRLFIQHQGKELGFIDVGGGVFGAMAMENLTPVIRSESNATVTVNFVTLTEPLIG